MTICFVSAWPSSRLMRFFVLFFKADTLQQIPAVQAGVVMEYAAKEVEHPDSKVRTFYENKHKQVNNNVEVSYKL